MMKSKLFACALTAALSLPAATRAEEAPGTFTIPGTQTTMRLYGYAQLDATYDVSSRTTDAEGYDWATFVPVQPLESTYDAQERSNQLFLTGRTTRIGFTTNTPTTLGPVGVKIEADFNGGNIFWGQTYTNSVLLRLRHLYGTVGGFMVGQSWTTFTDLASYADTVDFNGPGAVPLVRQPQLRYTLPIGSATLALAAENAANPVSGGPRTARVPDFVANFTVPTSWGHVSAGALTLRYDNSVHAKQGYGGRVSGSFRFGKDTFVFSAVGGEGIGRYLFNAYGAFAVDDGEALRLWKAAGYHVGFTHVWLPSVRSNVVWSQTFMDKNGITPTDSAVTDGLITNSDDVSNERVDQAFVNTFWRFAKNAEVGVEYAYGRRETFDGQTGKQDRVNCSFHYDFF
jgi:hypothetical protein